MGEERDERWLRDMHDDLRSLNEKVQRIEVSFAKFDSTQIAGQFAKHETKLTEHDGLHNQYKGAFKVIYFLLGAITAVFTSVTVWVLTH